MNSKIKNIIIILFFLIIFFQFLYSLRGIATSTPIDFLHYYLSSESLILGHDPYVYVPTHQLSNGMRIIFNYPPTALILFSPLAFMPVEIARIVWELLIFAALIAGIRLSFSLLQKKLSFSAFLITLSLSLLSFPIRHTFGMGQVSILILYFLLMTFSCLKTKKFEAAAFFFALSISLKIFPLIILPYLLLRKQYKFTLFTIVFLAIFIGISVLMVGREGWQEFLKVMPHPDYLLGGAHYYEQSLSAFFARLPGQFPLRFIMFITTETVILLGTGWSMFKSKSREISPLEISLLLIIAVIATGFNWQHYFAILLFPLLTLYIKWQQNKNYWWMFGMLIVYLLLSINFKNPDLVIKNWGIIGILALSHELCGAIIIWVVTIVGAGFKPALTRGGDINK